MSTKKYSGEVTVINEEDVEFLFEGWIECTPGRYSGAMEDCYPDESDGDLTFVRSNPAGHAPTEQDEESASEQLWEDAQGSDWGAD